MVEFTLKGGSVLNSNSVIALRKKESLLIFAIVANRRADYSFLKNNILSSSITQTIVSYFKFEI